LWKLMKTGIDKSSRKLTMTRLETWATPGVPDVIVMDERGTFHFVELKHTKGNAIELSPHQVTWMDNHKNGSAWILVRRKKDNEKATIRIYHAAKAVDARMDGVKHPADLIVEEPFNWDEIMGLMCPI
jgi:RecB family endonuclease NucS